MLLKKFTKTQREKKHDMNESKKKDFFLSLKNRREISETFVFSRIVKYTFFHEFDQQINTEAYCILVCEQSNGLAVRDARQVVSVDLNRKFKDFFAKLKSSF